MIEGIKVLNYWCPYIRVTYSKCVQGGMVQKVGELYENIKIMLDLSGVKSLDFVQACDIKAQLCVLGLGTASSTCPCPYCNLAKKLFNSYHFAHTGVLRTLGAIRAMAMAYMEAAKHHTGSKKLSSAEWDSCERMPLLDLDDLIFVLDVMMISELHLFTGIFNTLFNHLKKLLESAEDSTVKASDWSEKHCHP